MHQLREKSILEDRMFASRLPESASSALIIAPLIDVFFLLVIFLVLGAGLVRSRGIMIDPPAIDTMQYENADMLVIAMRPDVDKRDEVQLYFNNQKIDDYAKLENLLIKIVGETRPEASPGKRDIIVILRADKRVPLQEVAEVMSICRKHKLRLLIPTKLKE